MTPPSPTRQQTQRKPREPDVLPSKAQVIDVNGIDVSNDEAILLDGKAVGYVSSGGYGHHVKKSIALGYVPTELATGGQRLQVEIMGEMYDAEVQGTPLYDANGGNMRA